MGKFKPIYSTDPNNTDGILHEDEDLRKFELEYENPGRYIPNEEDKQRFSNHKRVSPRTVYDDEYDNAVRTDPTTDAVKALWKEKAVEDLAEMTGEDVDEIAKNFDFYAQSAAGTNDPKSVVDYIGSQYKAGQAYMNASLAFNDYLNTRDEEDLKRYEEAMAKVPDLPASPNRVARVAGLVANNIPMMVESTRRGQIFGAAAGVTGAAMGVTLGGMALATVAPYAGLLWGAASLAHQATVNKDIMAGSFGSELYKELEEYGIEPDLDLIRNLSFAVGAGGALVEGLQFNSVLSNIPGASRFAKSAIQKATVKALMSTKNKFFTGVGKRTAGAAAATFGGRMAGVMAENATEEALQAGMEDGGRALYKYLRSGNMYTRQGAEEKMRGGGVLGLSDGSLAPSVDKWRMSEVADRLPNKTIDELVEGWYTNALAGAVVGGALSLPGISLQGIKAGSTEYTMTKSLAQDRIRDIVKNSQSVEEMIDGVKNDETLRTLLGKRGAERKARIAETVQDLRTKQKVFAESRTISDGVVWRSPEGEIYTEEGYKLDRVPKGHRILDVKRETVEGVEKWVDSDNNTYNKPPWEPNFKDTPGIGKAKPYNIHRNPDTGTYVDEFGNEYQTPPEGDNVKVWEWSGYELKEEATTKEGQKRTVYTETLQEDGTYKMEPVEVPITEDKESPPVYSAYIEETLEDGTVRKRMFPVIGNMPWDVKNRIIEYTDPETGQTVETVVREGGLDVFLTEYDETMEDIRSSGMEIREEQAKALYYLYKEQHKAEDVLSEDQVEVDPRDPYGENYKNPKTEPLSFEEWIKENEITVNNEISRRFQADVEADLRNYRHTWRYAKSFLRDLSQEQRAFFEPSVDKLGQIIKDLDEGNRGLASFQDVMDDYAKKIDDLHNDLAKLRALRKSEKNKNEIRHLTDEIKNTQLKIFNEITESRMFSDLLLKTHSHIANAYYFLQQERQRLENLAETEAVFDQKIEDLEENIDTVMEAQVDKEAHKDSDFAEGGWYKLTEEDPKKKVTVSRALLDWKARKDMIRGKLEVFKEQKLASQASHAKKALRKRMLDLASRVLKDPPGTVHINEREKIFALQKLIDPAFRNAEKTEEMTTEWQKKYDELIDIIKEGDSDEKYAAIDDALEAAKRPLNKMRVQDLTNVYYTIEMLKAIGKARLAHEQKFEQMEVQTIIDYTIDMAKDLDIETLSKNYDTEQYQDYIRDMGLAKKKRTALSYILNPASLFDLLDGGGATYDGPLHDFFIKRRNEAYGTMRSRLNERRDNFNSYLDEIGYDKTRLSKWIQVGNDRITLQTAMTYYVALGDENFVGSQDIYDALISNKGNRVNPATMQMAVEQLTDGDKAVTRYILSDYQEVFPRLAETYRKLNNANLTKETTYIPLVREWMAGDEDLNDVLINEMLDTTPEMSAALSKEFTQERKKVLDENPIRTQLFDIWEVMAEKEERYINMADLVKKYKRVVSNKDFENAVKGTAGNGWYDAIDKYVQSQAKPYFWKEYDRLNKFAAAIKHHSAIAFLGYNVQTMLKQIPSIAFFLKHAGVRNVMATTAKYVMGGEMFKDGEIRSFLKDNDPLFKYRQSEVQTVMSHQDLATYKEWKSKGENVHNLTKSKIRQLGENSMKWIQWMDSQVVAIGEYATVQSLQEQGASRAEAVRVAQDITQRTQPNADPGMLPAIYKSNEFVRMGLIFAQQRMKIVDMLAYDLPQEIKAKRYKSALATLATVQLSSLMIILASEKRMPEDEEELAKWMAMHYVDLMPVLGDVIRTGVTGYHNMNPATDALLSAGNVAYTIGSDSTDEQNKRAVNDALQVISLAGPLPTAILRNMIKAAQEEDPWELVGGQEDYSWEE